MINLAIIPARGGSKGIYRKNMRCVAGKPLISWTISSATSAKNIDEVVVSTDDQEIVEVSKKYGAKVHMRSDELAKDNVHAVHVVIECLNEYKNKGVDIGKVVMLLPTSPLRSMCDIDGAIKIFGLEKCDSVISVCCYDKPISSLRVMDNNSNNLIPVANVSDFNIQRQEIKDKLLEVNGSIYVSTPEHLLAHQSFHAGVVRPYIMKKTHSIDVNDLDDLEIVEAILCQRLYIT